MVGRFWLHCFIILQSRRVYLATAAYTSSHSFCSFSSPRSTPHVNVNVLHCMREYSCVYVTHANDTNIQLCLPLLCSLPVPHCLISGAASCTDQMESLMNWLRTRLFPFCLAFYDEIWHSNRSKAVFKRIFSKLVLKTSQQVPGIKDTAVLNITACYISLFLCPRFLYIVTSSTIK